MCCDELNQLVPFCSSDTDKATTLQWTLAFLKHIREIHGDSLKDVILLPFLIIGFQKAFNDFYMNEI